LGALAAACSTCEAHRVEAHRHSREQRRVLEVAHARCNVQQTFHLQTIEDSIARGNTTGERLDEFEDK
jgi:hypothetical protein